MEKTIEIPFGAKDSELKGWEYTIPKNMEAEIKDGKIIVKQKESEDERIRQFFAELATDACGGPGQEHYEELGLNYDKVMAYLEKQKEQNTLSTEETKLNYIAFLEQLGYTCIPPREEQKPLMSDGEIEDRKRAIVAAIRKYYSAEYAEYLTSFLKGLSPEDNSADEYGQEMLGIAYRLMYEHIPENLRTQEFWDSLKFMREYTGKVAIIPSYEKPTGWSEEDENMLESFLHKLEVCDLLSNKEIIWAKLRLKSLPERFIIQPKQEWSEEDEEKIDNIIRIICNARECSKIANIGEEKEDNSTFYDELVLFLKSLRPQSKSVKEKESYKNWFETARRNVARAFMQYLDENKIDGKMCLSNGECEDIEKAFFSGDWGKISRYANKYLLHWKPSEEQMAALSWFCNGVVDGVCAPDLRGKLKSLYNDLLKNL